MNHKIDYSLYLVTDQNLMSTSTIEESVELAIQGGCTIVQLREKTGSSLAFFECAKRVKAITNHYNIPLIINDRVDIALAIDAEGVHVGQTDMPGEVVRKILGPYKILGISASSLPEAIAAQQTGADYLGVGAMFSTQTKTDANLVSIEELKEISSKIKLPIVAIGGINKNTVPLFSNTGIDGIAVVSAIISQADIPQAARELKKMFENLKKEI